MRLFIVSNRLPVKITCFSDGKFVFSQSEGGLQVCSHWTLIVKNIGSVGLASAWNKRRKKMTFAVNWKKIIIIRYSYPTNSIKITTKDIATVPYSPSVITFLHIRYIKKTFGNHIGKSMLFFVKRYLG